MVWGCRGGVGLSVVDEGRSSCSVGGLFGFMVWVV